MYVSLWGYIHEPVGVYTGACGCVQHIAVPAFPAREDLGQHNPDWVAEPCVAPSLCKRVHTMPTTAHRARCKLVVHEDPFDVHVHSTCRHVWSLLKGSLTEALLP